MSFAAMDTIPGRVRRRCDVPTPAGYAVFDCETTGIDPERDEIVSFAVVRLNARGDEVARLTTLVRPSQPIPPEATAVHGISDADVARAPTLTELAPELFVLLEGAVFVAHNAGFDLSMLKHDLAVVGVRYQPPAVACTLEAFRLLEPLAPAHSLEALCDRYGIELDAHHALDDALATAALLRVVLAAGLAPETVELDEAARWRMRSRGDTRPATERQIARVFALGYDAGLSEDAILELVARVAHTTDVDALTREQVQDVYDALALDRAA
jgi:DNA polymerase III epsilon subunit family exonuclease